MFSRQQIVRIPHAQETGVIVSVSRPAPFLYGIQRANGCVIYRYGDAIRAASEFEVKAFLRECERGSVCA